VLAAFNTYKNKQWEHWDKWGVNHGINAMSSFLKVREGKIVPYDRRFRYVEFVFPSGEVVRKPGGTFITPAPKTAKIVEAINKVLAEDDERPLTPKDLGLVKEEPEPEAKPEPPWRKSMYYGRKAG
jgi:hypothetical protein